MYLMHVAALSIALCTCRSVPFGALFAAGIVETLYLPGGNEASQMGDKSAVLLTDTVLDATHLTRDVGEQSGVACNGLALLP